METVGFFDFPRIIALIAKPRHCFAVAPTQSLSPNDQTYRMYVQRVDRLIAFPDDVLASAAHTAWELVRRVIDEYGIDTARLPAEPLLLNSFDPASEDRAAAARWKAGQGVRSRYVVFHPCAADPLKNWPSAKFARLADCLTAAWDVDVVITGSARDAAVGEAIRAAAAHPERVFATAGEVGMTACGALYEAAVLLVTVDTAAMHLADAVGCPLVALFLPWRRYTRYLPLSQPHSVVFASNVPDFEPPFDDRTHYLESIGVDEVITAIRNRLPGEPLISTRAR